MRWKCCRSRKILIWRLRLRSSSLWATLRWFMWWSINSEGNVITTHHSEGIPRENGCIGHKKIALLCYSRWRHWHGGSHCRTSQAPRGTKVPDDDFTMILITSLPKSWDSFTMSFLGSSSTKSDTIKSQELVRILIDESCQQKKKDRSESGGVVMQAKRKRYQRESSGGSELECFNCHKTGHMKTEY